MKNLLVVAIFLIMLSFQVCWAETTCDFNGSSSITNDDLMVLLAYQRVKSDALLDDEITLDIATVQNKARNITGKNTLNVSRLPDGQDKLEDSLVNNLSNTDLFLFAAYQKVKSEALLGEVTLNFTSVEEKAQSITDDTTIRLGKLPGTPIGTASFTTTITGITTDP